MDLSIRMMTRAEKLDRLREKYEERYRELFELEVERQRDEWIEEFGDNPRIQFKPNGPAIHKIVMQQMNQ